ncbi:MAG: hypothetical protein V3U67_03635 [Gemmatimonadota bacterium]
MKSGLRSKGLVTVLLTLTFAAGAAVGVAGDRMVAAENIAPETDIPAAHRGRFTIEKYADELGLTASQREQIAPILDDVMAQAEALAEEIRPRLVVIGEGAKARIKEFLTPEQIDQYEEILAERENAERQKKEAAAGRAPPGVDLEE